MGALWEVALPLKVQVGLAPILALSYPARTRVAPNLGKRGYARARLWSHWRRLSPYPRPSCRPSAAARVKRLSLFSSAARGELGPQSEVDLLVEFEPEAAVGFLTLARMARQLSELLGPPVDLVPRSGLKPILRERVLREERVLCAS